MANEKHTTVDQMKAMAEKVDQQMLQMDAENDQNHADHIGDENNPHRVTAEQVGLGNVNNTSDTDKPVSTAQKVAIDNALDSANSYTDTKTSGLASTTVVDNKITTHNTSASAHNDIRLLIADLTTKLNNFLDVDDTTTDQLSEVITLINNNKGTLESLTTSKVNVSDIVNNLTTSSTSKVLSANQGVAIKELIDSLQSELDSHTHAMTEVSGLQTALDGKAPSSHGTHVSYSTTAPVMDGTASVGTASTVSRSDHKHPTDTSRAAQTSLDSHTGNTTVHITSAERTNWNAAKTHADSAHAPSNAQANQNAFSNIKIGDITIAADTTTDTLTLVGSNVTLTPDATNDKVTIAVADSSTSAKGIVQLTNSTSSTSTTTAATPSSVKSAYDLANSAKAAAAAAQSTADSKSESGHTHSYAGSSSAGGAATSANKLNTNAGSATQPVYFANGVPVATTYTLGKSVPSNAVFTDTNTHYASKNVVGATNATSNTSTALSNGAVYLNSVENGAVTSSHKISGSGATTVTTDASGNIVISSTDNNTTYGAAGSSLGLVKSGGDVTISSGVITVNDDSHNHTIANIDNLQSSLDSMNSEIDGSIKTLSVSGQTITYTKNNGTTGTITTQDTNTTYSNFVKSGSGAKAGLVPAPSTTAGATKYLREDGTWAVPPNTNTDTKVTQTVTTSNASYPLLLAPSGQTATATTTSYFDSGVTLNPSTNTIAANISGSSASCTGNAATATIATQLGNDSVGNANNPIYLSKGVPTTCNMYAGGTLVVMNSTSYQSSIASFFAPTEVGTNGYILKSNGSGAPTWLQTLPIANGGTGATNAADALKNLGLTATAAELNYTDGVTSNIQTQLDGKQPLVCYGEYTGDLDDITTLPQNSVAWVTPDTVNNPYSNYGLCETWGSHTGGTVRVQRITYTNRTVCMRIRYNGAWTEWEWDNPPMALGTEYRLTKRFAGSVVYAKYVNIGTLPTNGTTTTIAHGITGYARFLTTKVFARTGASGQHMVFDYGGTNCHILINGDSIKISAGDVSYNTFGGYVYLEYTKS